MLRSGTKSCMCVLASDTASMRLANLGSGRTPLTGALRSTSAQLIAETAERVGETDAHLWRQRAIDRRAEPVVPLHAANRAPRKYLLVAGTVPEFPGSGKLGLTMFSFLLADAVEPQRLFVDAGVQPVVEHAQAASDRRLAVRAGRPRQAEARREAIEIVHVRLRFVAEAGAERQVLANPDVVLDVAGRPGASSR